MLKNCLILVTIPPNHHKFNFLSLYIFTDLYTRELFKLFQSFAEVCRGGYVGGRHLTTPIHTSNTVSPF